MFQQALKTASAFATIYPELNAEDKTVQKVGLNDVPEDIHHLILSELVDSSPSTLLSVSQSSKTLQDAALPYMYRHLKLHQAPKGSKELLAYETLLDKFRGAAAKDIARHVRNITVQDQVPSEDLILILEKIVAFGRLREFNWNTSTHIPEKVLDKLHSTWPDLEISATIVDRHKAQIEAHHQMDLRLLSSPLLTRLTCAVYDQGSSMGELSRSEWPKLSQALFPSSKLKNASLEGIVGDTQPKSMPRLHFWLGADFSKLEQLSIQNVGYTSYLWDEAHCRSLRDSMDLSCLQALDFGDRNPEAFFEAFTGHLPNLKSLRFGFTRNSSLLPVKGFIDSLSALESLRIDAAKAGLDELWPVINKHKDTLKTLVLGPTWGTYCSPEYIDRSLLKTVANTFPKVKRLGWQVPFTDVNDKRLLKVLSKMNLRKLDLYINIPDQASEYSEKLEGDAMSGSNNPPLKRAQSIASATRIAESISQKQKDPLEWLTLHISRTLYMDRCQPYMTHTAFQLRQKERPGADNEKYQVRGKMDWGWHSSPLLREELLFEED
ncbi:hypothetical protein P171DRAFT_460880 [Karstenula rhodostoma CBS 690.94]|uniref:F-box domain-containing protein n=1 Tax=Karstenula rhodostoma CBS 690.94 TaxID=1392251 RepID=A0A9P4UHL4_9PLEO|nr:hypothetical protein P171DRAFT_460880 [Karstenula rhodostoma CBS 690.94]